MDRELPIKHVLPRNFLKEEVKCGFKVTKRLKKIQAIELDLLAELMRVCKKYDLKIQIFGGSLLGAVRHKGFIPWDDDLDVCIMQKDFDKLCSVADKEFSYPYHLQTNANSGWDFLAYGRLRNSETTGAIDANKTLDINHGIYIDIYVLNGRPESIVKQKWQELLMRAFGKGMALTSGHYTPRTSLDKLLYPISRVFKCVSQETWQRWWFKALRMYTKDSEWIGNRHELTPLGRKYFIRRSDFDNSIELPFENLVVPAPATYHEVLTRIYKNYMEMPPIEQRGQWHSQVYFDPDMPYKVWLRNSSAEH